MRIINEIALDFSDVLIQPKRSKLTSRSDVDITRKYKFVNSGVEYHDHIPIIAANMDQIATFEFADSLINYNISTALHKHYTEEKYVNYFNSLYLRSDTRTPVFYTMGSSENELAKLTRINKNLFNGKISHICMDNANGYTENFHSAVSRLRDLCPEAVIMAGNVVTPEVTEQLILSGADIVKCGIGSGSVCTTRKMTGVGVPQLTATIECADAAHGLNGHICSDGGMTVPGDVVKAFAAGADFTMLGGMFSGHRETGLPIIETPNGPCMECYGMSSKEAMNKHSNGVAKYRAAEGKRVLIPLKDSLDETVQNILGGIRSACTYVGSENLKNLNKRTTFRIVNNQLNTVFGDG